MFLLPIPGRGVLRIVIEYLSGLRVHGKSSIAFFDNLTEVDTLELEGVFPDAIVSQIPLVVRTVILSNFLSHGYHGELDHLDDDDYYRGACD